MSCSPVALSEVRAKGPLKFVDAKKYYNLKVQLGAKTRWRGFRGGKWELVGRDDTTRQSKYQHAPRVHDVEQVSGKIVNGLIQAHNDWLDANTSVRQPAGDISRQVVVFKIEETEPPAAAYGDKLTVEMVKDMIQAAVTSAIAAVSQKRSTASQS